MFAPSRNSFLMVVKIVHTNEKVLILDLQNDPQTIPHANQGFCSTQNDGGNFVVYLMFRDVTYTLTRKNCKFRKKAVILARCF